MAAAVRSRAWEDDDWQDNWQDDIWVWVMLGAL